MSGALEVHPPVPTVLRRTLRCLRHRLIYARLWVGRRSYLLRESLQQLEDRVRLHGFVRVHRQALVPLAGVRALQLARDGSMFAVLDSGVQVRVSRRRRVAFAAAVRSQLTARKSE